MNDLEKLLKWQTENAQVVNIMFEKKCLCIDNVCHELLINKNIEQSEKNIEDQIEKMISEKIDILNNLELFVNDVEYIFINPWKYELNFKFKEGQEIKYYLNVQSLLDQRIIYDLRSGEDVSKLASISNAKLANKKELLDHEEVEYFNKDNKYGVYCGTGNSAARIAKKFTELGYDVISVGGRKTTLKLIK